MDKKTIYIKENKLTHLWEYIATTSNNYGITLYNYYNGKNVDTATKSTFNKYAFIEYLKSVQIPKKYITKVEKYM